MVPNRFGRTVFLKLPSSKATVYVAMATLKSKPPRAPHLRTRR
jgi:hypothetical protein